MRVGFHLSIAIVSIVIAILLSASSASAVINPQILIRDRDRASEKLVLKVRKVSVVAKGLSRHVTARAKVQLVRQSRSGLKKGDNITIKYTSRTLPKRMPGPKPIPIISKGTIGAFLHESKGKYFPAARSMSFVSAQTMRSFRIKPKPKERRRPTRRPPPNEPKKP